MVTPPKAGAPKGNANARKHGLYSRYVDIAEIATLDLHPAEQLELLLSISSHRAMTAHRLDPAGDDANLGDQFTRHARAAALIAEKIARLHQAMPAATDQNTDTDAHDRRARLAELVNKARSGGAG